MLKHRVECRVSSVELGNRIPGSNSPKPETPNPKHNRQAGFTLLEVIVALAILAIGFALAVELLATGVRSAKAAEDYTQAVLLAREKMAEMAAAPSVEQMVDQGEFGGGFRWITEVRPLPQEEEMPAQLYQVWVRVTWPSRRGEKSVDLTTLRMVVNEKRSGQTAPSGGFVGGRAL